MKSPGKSAVPTVFTHVAPFLARDREIDFTISLENACVPYLIFDGPGPVCKLCVEGAVTWKKREGLVSAFVALVYTSSAGRVRAILLKALVVGASEAS